MRLKVTAYITWGHRLLVFHQPASPGAGVQVPGGSMEAGEDPRQAVLREAQEETGLGDLAIVSYLGQREASFENEQGDEIWERRHFYHLRVSGQPPERWQHWEMTPSEGPDVPILFELWWAPLGEAQALVESWYTAFLAEIGDGTG